MDELVAFLRAALDRDEQVAQQAAQEARSHEWLSGAEGSVFGVDEDSDLHIRGAVFSLDDIGAHIARWDPARVLAEIQAKRQVLDWCEARLHDAEDFPDEEQYQLASTDAWLNLIRPLAQPYAGQPGWRGEWQLSAPR